MTVGNADYHRWSDWLDNFAQGIDLPADALAAMQAMGGSEALPRLARRCDQALTARMNLWNQGLVRDLRAAQTGPPTYAVTRTEEALVRARRALVPLIRMASSSLLSAELRTALSNALRAAIENFQRSSEADARKSGPGGEEILRVLLRTPLDTAYRLAAESPPSAPPAGRPNGRQVLVQPMTETAG